MNTKLMTKAIEGEFILRTKSESLDVKNFKYSRKIKLKK